MNSTVRRVRKYGSVGASNRVYSAARAATLGDGASANARCTCLGWCGPRVTRTHTPFKHHGGSSCLSFPGAPVDSLMLLVLLPMSLAAEETDIADRGTREPAALSRMLLSLLLPKAEFETDIALPLPRERERSLRDLRANGKSRALILKPQRASRRLALVG